MVILGKREYDRLTSRIDNLYIAVVGLKDEIEKIKAEGTKRNDKKQVTPAQTLSEYLFGAEKVNE